jgi:hypothetical protein
MSTEQMYRESDLNEALIEAFDQTNVWIDMEDDEAFVTVTGTDDPRTIGTNAEDIFHRSFSLKEVIVRSVEWGGIETIDAIERALARARKEFGADTAAPDPG